MTIKIRKKTQKKWKRPRNQCKLNQFKNCLKLAKSTMPKRNSKPKNRLNILIPKINHPVVLGLELIPVMMHLYHFLTINLIGMVTPTLPPRKIIIPTGIISLSRRPLWSKRKMRRITKIKVVKRIWVRLKIIRWCNTKTWVRKIRQSKIMVPHKIWPLKILQKVLMRLRIPFLKRISLRLFHQCRTQISLRSRIHLVTFLGSRGLWIRWSH